MSELGDHIKFQLSSSHSLCIVQVYNRSADPQAHKEEFISPMNVSVCISISVYILMQNM